MLHHCFAASLHKCFVGYETSPDFPSAWGWVDNELIHGLIYPWISSINPSKWITETNLTWNAAEVMKMRGHHWQDLPTPLCDGQTLHIEAINDLILAHTHHSVWILLPLFSLTCTPPHSSIVHRVSLVALIGSMWFLLNTNQLHTWCTALVDKPTICPW